MTTLGGFNTTAQHKKTISASEALDRENLRRMSFRHAARGPGPMADNEAYASTRVRTDREIILSSLAERKFAPISGLPKEWRTDENLKLVGDQMNRWLIEGELELALKCSNLCKVEMDEGAKQKAVRMAYPAAVSELIGDILSGKGTAQQIYGQVAFLKRLGGISMTEDDSERTLAAIAKSPAPISRIPGMLKKHSDLSASAIHANYLQERIYPMMLKANVVASTKTQAITALHGFTQVSPIATQVLIDLFVKYSIGYKQKYQESTAKLARFADTFVDRSNPQELRALLLRVEPSVSQAHLKWLAYALTTQY